jgi:hypothetical protein
MKSPVYLGLEGLALALLFCPEPFTTVAAVWLLGYARAKQTGQDGATTPRRRENSFAHLYDYELQMVGESSVTYELQRKRSGQLPAAWPVTTKVYKIPQAWKAYSNGGNQQSTRTQLLNGVPLPARKAQPASGVQLPSRVRQASGIQQTGMSTPLAQLYQAQTLKKVEPARYTKSFSVLQRDHIARMLESMNYTKSFAAPKHMPTQSSHP